MMSAQNEIRTLIKRSFVCFLKNKNSINTKDWYMTKTLKISFRKKFIRVICFKNTEILALKVKLRVLTPN